MQKVHTQIMLATMLELNYNYKHVIFKESLCKEDLSYQNTWESLVIQSPNFYTLNNVFSPLLITIFSLLYLIQAIDFTNSFNTAQSFHYNKSATLIINYAHAYFISVILLQDFMRKWLPSTLTCSSFPHWCNSLPDSPQNSYNVQWNNC